MKNKCKIHGYEKRYCGHCLTEFAEDVIKIEQVKFLRHFKAFKKRAIAITNENYMGFHVDDVKEFESILKNEITQ